MELVGPGDLAILYSSMSHSLGIDRVPIMLACPESGRKDIFIGNLTEERAMTSGATTRENLFQPLQPTISVIGVSDGRKESSHGGDVIWV